MKRSVKHISNPSQIDDYSKINQYILNIGPYPENDQAILTLKEMIRNGKSELIFNTILGSSQLAHTNKKSVLHNIIEADTTDVFYDTFLSYISEVKAKKTIEQSRSSVIPQDPQENPLIALISTMAKTEGETPSRLENVMQKASEPMTYTLSGSTDGQEQAFAVQNYAALEKDLIKREQFATKQLNKYVESLNVTNLNTAEKEKISKALTAIMEPICSPKEKAGLKNSVDKLVRECAQHAGEKKSFKQAWRDNIVEPIKRLLGRENVLKSFEKEAIAIGQSIRKKIDTHAEQKSAPRSSSKIELHSR